MMPDAPPPTFAADLAQCAVNLVAGWALQIGRVVPLLGAKAKATKTRARQSREAVTLGRTMAQSGSGDAYLRQRITALEKSTDKSGVAREQEKLGLSGVQAAVPLLALESDYEQARAAYEAHQAAEARHRDLAAKFWPRGPFGWCGLIAGYCLVIGAVAGLVVYLMSAAIPSPVTPPETPAASAASEEIAASYKDIKVALSDAVIAKGLPHDFGNDVQSSREKLLRIKLTITNTGLEPVRYKTWRGHASLRGSTSNSVDNDGDSLLILNSTKTNRPAGGVYETVIAPNTTIEDSIDFGPPRNNFVYIDLFLPTVNVDPNSNDAKMKLHIPRSAVKKPGDALPIK